MTRGMFIFQKPTHGFLGSFYFFSGLYFIHFHCFSLIYLLTFALVLGGWFGFVWFGFFCLFVLFFNVIFWFVFVLSGIKLCLLEPFFS